MKTDFLKSWGVRSLCFVRRHGPKLVPILRSTKRHPLVFLAGFTMLLLTLGECYPFSNFPMYSSHGGKSYYLYLTDRNGEPIAIRRYFHISAAKVKKIYRAKQERFVKATGRKESSLTPVEFRHFADLTLRDLRGLTREKEVENVEKLEPLRLVRVDLALDDEMGFVRNTIVLAKGGSQ